MSPLIFIIFCAFALTALLWADYGDNRPLKWIAKTGASLCFVLLALSAGALESVYGQWILAGLILCMIGDICLIPKGQAALLAGMGAFALGHGAYIAAFLTGAPQLSALLAVAAVAMLAIGTASLRWLWPHLGRFKTPVTIYTGVIAVMAAASIIAAPNGHTAPFWPVVAGATGFAVSDLSVARDQFVRPDFFNRLWGLPLYYGAQLMLASSV